VRNESWIRSDSMDFVFHELFRCHSRTTTMKSVLVGERCCTTMTPRICTGDNMDELKKSQESMGAAAAGVKKQLSETATDVKEKLTEIGRDAAGQLAEVAQNATDKVKAATDYLRDTELAAMGEDIKDIVKRYPGWSIAAAAVVGFLLAHMGSRNTNRFNRNY
jgi:hypothetical protein